MNKKISKYIFYYPSTFLKGEMHWKHESKYEEFQYQPIEKIQEYQRKKLLELLKFVIQKKPFYQKLFCAVNLIQLEDLSLDKILSKLPIIDKATLIENVPAMTAEKAFLSSSKTTGGSTGEPVILYKNADALARERVATARSYKWAGVDIGDMQARFWGVPHREKDRLISKITDVIANRYRLSAFDLSTDSLARYYKELSERSPKYLYGYVSAIRVFSHYVKEHELTPISSLKSIITTSEVLSDADRSLFEEVWGVQVFNEYGCGEVGSIAHECEEGNMHLMSDNLIVEIDRPDNSKTAGELIVTDLHNTATPLIRYRIGDFSELENEPCKCGRTLPVLKGIYGRAYDLIETPEGKRLHPEAIIYIFEQIQSEFRVIRQFQVVQTKDLSFLINIVTGQGFKHSHEQALVKGFRDHISPTAQVSIRIVNEITREKSGKLRLVKRQK
ncbi:hypothetical protein N9211_02500 [Pseudomonadales bacterium]|nr:hypothetical protein [Pseudomonadales bacterium]